MRLISHRGNLTGPNPEQENSESYLDAAVARGFDVETDLWRMDNGDLYLGHDKPQYKTTHEFLAHHKNNFWIHCKNLEALVYLLLFKKDFNFFWHQTDDYTLTSHGFVWTYPGKLVQADNIIVVWENLPKEKLPKCQGICSDYVALYQ